MTSAAHAAWENHVDTRTGAPPARLDQLSELEKIRGSIGSSFDSLANLVGASFAPVPNGTGDGSKLPPDDDDNATVERIEGDLRDLSYLGISNIKTLIQIQTEKMTGELTDDKTYLMEGLIRTAARLPDGSHNREKLTHQFLKQLWDDLEHPPLSYLGAKYQYRSADGSFNSLKHPQLGAAGTPYARTVKPDTMLTPALPDPGVVFDSVMSRKHAELHPNRISSVLFYLASIIIHDCFRTDHDNYSNSMTSSYLDLSPLYGSNQEEQDHMRTRSDGKIKPDCFSESRLLFFPPGVGVLLVMFNRFHNYVVENLALINEQNRFSKPTPSSDLHDQEADKTYKAKLAKYDEDLFQTGRLITCGLYCNIILIDYVRTILDLNRTDSNWQLNPRAEMKDVPMGVGNQVSAEFNLVYRWHSTVSDRDEKWTQEMWNGLFGKDRDPKSVSKYEFVAKLDEVYKRTDKDPSKRSFAGIKRNESGMLPDDELVDILRCSVEDCANSFGPNRVPEVMRAIEVLGIEQARAWNLGTLNEFRKYFHLEPHKSFEDITKDAYVQEQLRHLYDTPDKVEIYPGIVVEDAKQPMAPGSGLTPPYTVSRAVLSDAVALVRGDRFYTLDYNPRTLTNWGYRAADFDLGVNNGCVFYKLILRAFPQHFSQNSIYAHYPLTIPSAMKEALKDLDKAHLYNFERPKFTAPPLVVTDYKLVKHILDDQSAFKVTWGKAMQYLMGAHSKNFMLAGDAPANAASRKLMSRALYIPTWESQVRTYYTQKTRSLLQSKGAKIANFHQVDIIRDIGNLVHVHFCAELFMLPLKTEETPHGIFTEQQLYLIMAAVFTLVFMDVDVAASFPLHVKALAATRTLGELVEANVQAIHSSGFLSSLMNVIWPQESASSSGLQSYGIHMIKRLLESGMDPKELVWGHVLATAGGMVANQGQLFAQIIEFFLVGDGQKHWDEVVSLAAKDGDEQAWERLEGFVLEAGRLNGETAVLRSVDKEVSLPIPTESSSPSFSSPPTSSPTGAAPAPSDDQKSTTTLLPGSKLFLHLRAASHDPSTFPNPNTLDPTRPRDSYIHLGHGAHACLGAPMTRVALTAMLREVARLKGLRPARGLQGKVAKVVPMGMQDDEWPYHAYLTEEWDAFWGFPCALKVNWDD